MADVQRLLVPDAANDDIASELDEDLVRLWDGSREPVEGGTSYFDQES